MRTQAILLILSLLLSLQVFPQSGINKSYSNAYYNNFCEHYDQGFLLVGAGPGDYERGYSLIAKTDINGSIIWKRYVKQSSYPTRLVKVQPTIDGGFVSSGWTEIAYDTTYPLFVKFNSCGEIEWSKQIDEYDNFEPEIIQFPDGSFLAIYSVSISYYMGTSRTVFLNMDANGNVTGVDTLNVAGPGMDLISQFVHITPDNHLLLSTIQPLMGGSTIIMKTDKHANLDWQVGMIWGESFTEDSDMKEDGTIYSSGYVGYAPADDHAFTHKCKDGMLLWQKRLLPGAFSYPVGPILIVSDTSYLTKYSDWGGQYFAICDSSGLVITTQLDTLEFDKMRRTSDQKIMAKRGNLLDENPLKILYKYRLNAGQDSLVPDSLYSSPHTYDYLCNGIIQTDTMEIVPVIITGIDENPLNIAGNASFDLYPNPAENFCYIQPRNIQGEGEIIVYTASGAVFKRVYFPEGLQNSIKIDMEHWNPGLYLIQLSTQGRTIASRRLIKL